MEEKTGGKEEAPEPTAGLPITTTRSIMPIYEYKCSKCGKIFEVFGRSLKDMTLEAKCPDCLTVSGKIFSNYNFQFSPYLKELREGNMVDY